LCAAQRRGVRRVSDYHFEPLAFNLLHGDESSDFLLIYGASDWIESHRTRHPTDLTLFLPDVSDTIFLFLLFSFRQGILHG
jgi:hypothetical protein